MMLSDIRDWVESLGITSNVYMGKLDAKQDKSIGVYNSKHEHAYKTAIGGPEMESYGSKYVTLLVHWNKSSRDTEKAAMALFEAVRDTREVTINNDKIKFIQPLYELQDVGTDDAGICEMVIEAAIIYERKGE
ncbi:minor capsid protein [Ruminococcus gauvreauii]|uniref:phage tail terminator protein n=1 Tax=Ruminococcus gauvreauii TaxID=438033 RepID=UPI003983DC2E